MLRNLYLIAVSTSLILSLGAVSSWAQDLSHQKREEGKSLLTQETLDPPNTGEKIDAEDIEFNADPLVFPTKPEEVSEQKLLEISLQQAVEIALGKNRNLEAARLTRKRSQQELKEAIAARFPTLTTQFDFLNTESAIQEANNIEFADFEFGNLTPTVDGTVTGTIRVDYDVYTGGLRSSDIRRAKRQLEFNQLDVERIAEDTRLTVTSNYYDLQNATAQVEIETASVDDAAQTLRDAQLLEQAGLGTKFDVLRAEVELANAQQTLSQAVSELRRTRRQLAQTLSLPQNIQLAAADEIEAAGQWDFSLEESIVLAYKNRVELEQFLLQREIDDAQKEMSLSAIRPQISVFADFNFFDEFDNGVRPTDGYTLGGTISWQIFDGGIASAVADQEETDIELAETNFATQRNQIRFEVETAFFDLTANQNNIRTAEKAVETAQESLRLARLRFQAGVGTQTDVIEAQTELTTARGNFLTAIIGYNQALNQLQRAVSNLPDNRLFEQP